MGFGTAARNDHHLVMATMRRFQQAAHRALDEAHAILNGVRATGVDDQNEACRRSRGSYPFVKILDSYPGYARMRDRVHKRRPEIQPTRRGRATGCDDRPNDRARVTGGAACAMTGMLDRQLRGCDRFGFEEAVWRAAI